MPSEEAVDKLRNKLLLEYEFYEFVKSRLPAKSIKSALNWIPFPIFINNSASLSNTSLFGYSFAIFCLLLDSFPPCTGMEAFVLAWSFFVRLQALRRGWPGNLSRGLFRIFSKLSSSSNPVELGSLCLYFFKFPVHNKKMCSLILLNLDSKLGKLRGG